MKVPGFGKRPKAFPQFADVEKPSYAQTQRFPEDVTRLSLADVSREHARYVALHCYALSLLSGLRIDVLRLESEKSVYRNNLIRQAMTYGAKERWKMDRGIETNPDVEKLNLQIAEVQAKREEAEMFTNVFDKYATALSREITRRGSEGRHV